jgi:hypothetical protein
MKQYLFFLFLLLKVILSPAAPEADPRPEPEQIAKWVLTLGDERYAVRESAQQKLGAWAGRYPRYMLGLLSEQYSMVDDIEVESRLYELIEPLAMNYLFSTARGFLGVNLNPIEGPHQETLIMLTSIQGGSAAEKAGLRDQDIVIKIDGTRIGDLDGTKGFSDYIANLKPGTAVELVIVRGDTEFLVNAQLGMRDSNIESQGLYDQRRKEFQVWLKSLRAEEPSEMPTGHHPLDIESGDETPSNQKNES